jgi:hypothetical protein
MRGRCFAAGNFFEVFWGPRRANDEVGIRIHLGTVSSNGSSGCYKFHRAEVGP